MNEAGLSKLGTDWLRQLKERLDSWEWLIHTPDGTEADAFWSSADKRAPEINLEEEMSAIEWHIKNTFGAFENVFHELVSPDIHVDICVVPPTEKRDYYTQVTMGMRAYQMNVPEELAGYKLEFRLPALVSEQRAMDAAVEQYGFCPDVIDQGQEDATVGALAAVLRQSTVWYFWWD